jgi:hypothetical protein
VRIKNSGAPSQQEADVSIWGLTPSLMNQLSTLGMKVNLLGKNSVTVQAGDAESGMTTVFVGTIFNAYGDYSSSPDVPLRMTCQFGGAQAVVAATPSSYRGSTPVSTIMSNLASQLGCGFENNGVNAVLRNPYLWGSAMNQVAACRRAAGVGAEFVIPAGSANPTLSIFNLSSGRNTPSPPLISPATGMIAYPSFTQQGILVRTVFNPAVQFFGQVQVQSSVPQASGTWIVHKLDHALDSLLPRGEWSSDVYCYEASANPVLPPP